MGKFLPKKQLQAQVVLGFFTYLSKVGKVTIGSIS